MKTLASSCFLIPFFVFSIAAADYTPIPDKIKVQIETPSLAKRITEKIRLENGLEAYLISDPLSDQSGASMTVKAGSWEDPKDSPGMAHFLEHMLFLGTKKYPGESDYDRYITEHGGTSNAFTTNDFTSYLFTINHNAFPEALDRFSNFFKEPLFNPSGVDRELQAIDQEYAKNIENDDFRQLFVHKALSNPDHPQHAFSMGNRATLSKVSQDSLKEWYRTHYSANQMRLVVLSSEPIDQLRARVIDDFSGIPNFGKEPFRLDQRVTPDSLKGALVSIVPFKNIRKLTLLWEMPAQLSEYPEYNPDLLVCYVLGHEGKGSLFAQLKSEKLADALSCGSSKIGPQTLEFYLDIDLTPLGMSQYELVIQRVFQALAMMRREGISKELFEEVQQQQMLEYRFQSREEEFNMLMKLAILLAHNEIDSFPEQSFILQKYDAKIIHDFLAYLTPQNVVFDLVASAEYLGENPDKIEPWLGSNYSVKHFSAEQLENWSNVSPHPDMALPDSNPYLPKVLTLYSKPVAQQSLLPVPRVIIDEPIGKVFFAEDTRYLVPRISWNFEIKTPQIENGNPAKVVLGDLYVKALKDAINFESYFASLAGIDVEIERTDNGFGIHINGYNEKADILLKDLFDYIKNLKITPIKFRLFKEALLRQYQNANSDSPFKQVIELFRSVIFKNFTTNKEKAAAIKKINYSKFNEFLNHLFDRVFVEGLLYGNMTEGQAKSVSHQMLVHFNDKVYPFEERLRTKLIVLPKEKGPFYTEVSGNNKGSAVFLGIQALPFSFKSYASQQILMQAMKEPFFSTLRTKQQTAYLVYSSSEEIERFLFNCFLVQSNTHDGRDLLARFELFIEDFLQEMTKNDLNLERFQKIRQALLSNLRQPPKNMMEMGQQLSTLAFRYDADFEWLDKQIRGMEELTYKEFLEHVYQTMGKNNKRRLAVSLRGKLPEDNALQYSRIGTLSQMRALGTFKNVIDLTE